jgi:pyruvate/2-oxoglutarate dehydrogenase complex dihydrolipoamide dehydrogenase (E3) component
MAYRKTATPRNFFIALLLVVSLCSSSLAVSPLDKKVTLALDKTTTGHALEKLSVATGLKIEIDNKALAEQGITKNQTFGIDLRDTTARKALDAILLKGDEKKRLVYFVKKDGTIFVTTIFAIQRAKPSKPFAV